FRREPERRSATSSPIPVVPWTVLPCSEKGSTASRTGAEGGPPVHCQYPSVKAAATRAATLHLRKGRRFFNASATSSAERNRFSGRGARHRATAFFHGDGRSSIMRCQWASTISGRLVIVLASGVHSHDSSST